MSSGGLDKGKAPGCREDGLLRKIGDDSRFQLRRSFLFGCGAEATVHNSANDMLFDVSGRTSPD
jgi:hypothetical protein